MFRLAGLAEDQAWFEASRVIISQQYPGMWVLVKDRAVVGAYPDQASAYTAGVGMFGTQPFLVKQALAEEQIRYI